MVFQFYEVDSWDGVYSSKSEAGMNNMKSLKDFILVLRTYDPDYKHMLYYHDSIGSWLPPSNHFSEISFFLGMLLDGIQMRHVSRSPFTERKPLLAIAYQWRARFSFQ